MNSPKLSKSPIRSSSASASTSSSPVQESPFSNYISSLSPIKHDKAPHVVQGFLGLNSPPLVFTSPRINTLGRPQSSSVEVSQNGEGDKKRTHESCILERSLTEFQDGLVIDIKKEDDNKDNVPVQPSSSSGCIDEYLADPVEADCVNSAYAVNSNLKQSNNVLQSSVNGLAESKNIKIGNKTNVGSEVDAAQLLSGLSEENIDRKLNSDDKSLKIENEQGAAQGLSDEFQKFESDTFDLLSKEKEYKNLIPQKLVEDHGDGCNGFLQQLPGSLRGVQLYEDFTENVGGNVSVPVHSMTHDLEANELQRGMSRRCLQFGEAQPQARANCSISTNLADNLISSTSFATTSETEGLSSSHLASSVAPRTSQLVNLSQLAINLIPQCYGEKSSLTVPKPSGIGLHLNSIVNAIPMAQGGSASMELAQAIKSTCQSTENMGSCSDEFEKASDPPQDGTLEVTVCTIADSAVSESLSAMESIECNMTLNTKRKVSSEDGNSDEVFDQQSPKKKRQKLSNNTDGEGCKRCNCKRTKCLKLYCDCFAAGIYCSEPCSCQGCLNRPEYEDTVLETRNQIESRNPLAFAPKIVQPFTEFPLSNREDGNRKTPSSARHKRGCNCKRSMCLKKYCECYQANVGCSIGCRCEGCKNVYGKKEDYCVTEEMINRSGGGLERRVTAKPKDVLHSELFDPHHLTPLTPSFQCSDHGKKASISKLLSRRCLPSPESDLTILSYAKSPRSPRTSDSNDMLLETSKGKLDIESYCEGIGYNNVVVLADEFHHTPLPNHPSNVIGSSLSKARELTNLSRFQLEPRSGSLSSGGSLLWHSSPITPMSPLDENKNLQGLDSADGGLFDILEDDMPEILKDTSMPVKPVKAGSPNGKRVSPPHNLHQLGSSSSGPLRSGRKFILKAVPSFPPLTPCTDSKGSGTQSKNDLQENRSKC
ncbi:CRC domain-containing protein TSO1-like isoform X2 [Hibiscus syriacus]|uniref:CRC domain-containing protein TSO1-like isoform X2 n=1 Tax=Hibiscus syriacus TaxID=106335 RepID=UPI0019234D1A|nr:CRC domain-containing protein TSO1-like isoform X2 [Hibiscus syriacus]